MICESCRGRGFVPLISDGDDDETEMEPCPDCAGGIAYCCEGYSEAEIERSQQRIAAILGELPEDDA